MKTSDRAIFAAMLMGIALGFYGWFTQRQTIDTSVNLQLDRPDSYSAYLRWMVYKKPGDDLFVMHGGKSYKLLQEPVVCWPESEHCYTDAPKVQLQ